jgi:hypothetical protein
LNSYLAFCESGQIYEEFPDAKDRRIVISIFARDRPTEAGDAFLAAAGFELRFTFRPDLLDA